VMAVKNCCYVAVCSATQGASAPKGEGEGRGHIVTAYSLLFTVTCTDVDTAFCQLL